MSAERFSIAQVTPFAWEQAHEVNHFVERLSDELCARGHRVVVVAPSNSRELVRESRAAVTALAEDPQAVFAPEGCARVLGVGQSLSIASSRRSSGTSLPGDVSRTIESLLATAPFDFVHVHEPFAPSAPSAALRHSRALNVGTFHAASEPALSLQVARRFTRFLLGRLDGRTASYQATQRLVERFFPGDYRVIHPGCDLVERPAHGDGSAPDPASSVPEILLCAEEERGAVRLFLKALRRLPSELPWRATVWSHASGQEPVASLAPLGRTLRERVRFAGPSDGSEAQHLARAQIVVAASGGAAPSPQLLLRALAGGAVPVASRLPQYEEVLDEGERGLLFEPKDADTLAAQLARLIDDPALKERLRQRTAAAREALAWSRAADSFEDLYRSVARRRHSPSAGPALQKRLSSHKLIDVDLHMHTDHSPDCATPVETLLEVAVAQGLGAIAVTDHNEVSGAQEARERAGRDGTALKVIVSEEIKTADQGEIIGLFLEEKVPRGMSLEETLAAIRRQNGLVYVPHPFDRMHSVPDYEHMLSIVEDIDALEVFNPRIAVPAFNEEAARFAAKYRIPAGAGSDSHVAQSLGSVRIRMRDFDGPEEFLESLREADIVHKRQSLLYVQTLKFLQTKARTPQAKRARRASAGASDRAEE